MLEYLETRIKYRSIYSRLDILRRALLHFFYRFDEIDFSKSRAFSAHHVYGFQQIYLNTAGIIALVIIYSILAIGLDQIIRRVEMRLTHWTERTKISLQRI